MRAKAWVLLALTDACYTATVTDHGAHIFISLCRQGAVANMYVLGPGMYVCAELLVTSLQCLSIAYGKYGTRSHPQDNNRVCVHHGRQSMRHQNGGPLLPQIVQCSLPCRQPRQCCSHNMRAGHCTTLHQGSSAWLEVSNSPTGSMNVECSSCAHGSNVQVTWHTAHLYSSFCEAVQGRRCLQHALPINLSNSPVPMLDPEACPA